MAFGEVLWDIFPDGKKLGGAPLNFSYYFKKAGGNPKIVSAVGNDILGNEALMEINKLELDTSYIQQINRPTGKVNILLSAENHKFKILRGVAWEDIHYPINELATKSSGIYFGTVARSSQRNRRTLDRLLEKTWGRVIFLDLNLRYGFYNIKDISKLLTQINYLKINEEEARTLMAYEIVKVGGEEDIVESLIKKYGLNACVITLGERGAVSGDKNGIFRVKGISAKSGGDSVGSGDAFAAFWLANLLNGISMKESLNRANEIASQVASERGAIIEL